MFPGELQALFEPRSVAVFGASRSQSKISGRPLALMRQIGYPGEVYAINPSANEVQGHRAYADLSKLPIVPEAAIIALPRDAAVDAVAQCAEAGIKIAVVFSSGFREAGGAGSTGEAEMLRAARAAGMRILGPNCMGAFDVMAPSALTFAQAAARTERKGGLSIVSQSGAIASYIASLAVTRSIGLSKWVATGNEVDITVAECIAHLAADPSTRVIAAYLEGISNGPELLSALRAAAENDTPVVLLKSGRSAAGAAAASTHTGALAGDNAVFEAAVTSTGAILSDSIEEMLDVAALLNAGCHRPERIAICSISGGAGILMADAAEAAGLALPGLPDSVAAQIAKCLPTASLGNPLDTTATIIEDFSRLSDLVNAYDQSGAFDAVVLFLGTIGHSDAGTAAALAAIDSNSQRGMSLVLVLQGSIASLKAFADRGHCVIEDPTRAIRAVASIAARRLRRPDRSEGRNMSVPAPIGPLNEAASKELLAVAGLPVLEETCATSPEAAEEAVRNGGRFAFKLLSPDILHKSDIGGVVLNVSGRQAAHEAYDRIIAAARAASPEARIDGVLVSEMMDPIGELIVGTIDDPTFGTAVMVGLGGIFSEITRDTVIALAPVSVPDARDMIDRLAGVSIFKGARGRHHGDLEAAAEAVSVLSEFAAQNAPWALSVEINPLAVLPKGVVALDAAISPKLSIAPDSREPGS